jgi:hypothetical protein
MKTFSKTYRNKKKAISIALVFYFLISPLLFAVQVDTCAPACPMHAEHMEDHDGQNMHNPDMMECEMMGNVDMQNSCPTDEIALPTCQHDSKIHDDAELITINRITFPLDVQSYISFDFLQKELTSFGTSPLNISHNQKPEQISISKTVLLI